ncbi:hypothetical protein LA348_23100 (plasmid) [Citrobacter amalonaticus]|nr:hypothetical protein [Citrobacter amalonaticus]UBI23068.1 hypothetical protein LA348_23100 [Citrobacter amalonaticus]BCU50906.1 hypothetical protein CIAM_44270 [Citrobacter amalonaticus]
MKLKRRDAAQAAAQDLNAQGWLPDWMVRADAVTQDASDNTASDLTDHAA